MQNTIERIKNAIASTFEIPLETISDDSSSQTIEKWDSIGHINLVMALEQDFCIKFTMDEIMQMRDLRTLNRVIKGKTAKET